MSVGLGLGGVKEKAAWLLVPALVETSFFVARPQGRASVDQLCHFARCRQAGESAGCPYRGIEYMSAAGGWPNQRSGQDDASDDEVCGMRALLAGPLLLSSPSKEAGLAKGASSRPLRIATLHG